jgi:hypothetical protein
MPFLTQKIGSFFKKYGWSIRNTTMEKGALEIPSNQLALDKVRLIL